MTLLQNASAIGFGLTVPFQGASGVPPYSYAVITPVPIGSIDPGTGLYTSGNLSGIDTIEVTDSTPVTPLTAQATIAVLSPVQLFCDVIKKEMGLASDQVHLWDQKFQIPNDSRLYITVGVLTCKPFANSNQSMSVGSTLVELQSTNFLATLSIDVQSRSLTALDRKEEVILALNSNYAKQQMELNGFYIAPISTAFVDISQVDGAAIPYRFNISTNIQYKVVKSKPIEYYDEYFDTASQPEVVTDPESD